MAARLPPLNSLRAFEAAARHMSFARAAEELFVTQSAVSQQVKQLEAHLGLRLFIRQNNALTLTDAGRALLPQVRDAFKGLIDATASVKARDFENVLKISAPPTFSTKWLRPRLVDFNRQHPDIEIKLLASKGWVDFSREDFDASIRYGRGDYQGVQIERVMDEEIFPVCSPALARGTIAMRSLADLRFHTLLHAEHASDDETAPDWVRWIRTMGVEGVDARKGPAYSPAFLAIDAAIAGEGIALAKGKWVCDDLVAGRLIRPFEESLPSPYGYFLLYPAGGAAVRKVTVFRRWLFDTAGARAIAPIERSAVTAKGSASA